MSATPSSAEVSHKEHFLPVPLAILTDSLAEHLGDVSGKADFQRFAEGLVLYYDALFSQRLELLKHLYYPFNPDWDTLSLPAVDAESLARDRKTLMDEIKQLLQQANFQSLDQEMLHQALNKISPQGVEVSVDLEEFEEILIYYCGSAACTVKRRDWRRLYLQEETFTIPVYQRLFVLLKLKPWSGRLVEQDIFIKLFKEIPHSDLETIFPNTQIRLRMLDKIKLAVTGGGGVIGGVMSAMGRMAVAASPMRIVTALGALGAIIWREMAKVFSQRTQYMAKLSKSLYFYNLDNNMGALSWLIEAASSEEAKEVLLAYGLLWAQGGMTEAELDRAIERFMDEKFGVKMNFDVADGLRKLRDMNLLREEASGRLAVIEPPLAHAELREQWDALFPAMVD
ncbi:MAG: DUF3754 domain-containing protein [Methylohalobius sp. ZOD2]